MTKPPHPRLAGDLVGLEAFAGAKLTPPSALASAWVGYGIACRFNPPKARLGQGVG